MSLEDQKRLRRIINSAKRGSGEAKAELCQLFSREIRGFIFTRVNNSSTAADLEQEVYFQLLKNIEKIREPLKLKSSVLTTTYHVIQTYIRNKMAAKRSQISFYEDLGMTGEEIPENGSESWENEESIAQKMDFREAFRKLDPEEQRMMLLYAEGYKIDEIAERTGTTPVVAKARVYRTLKKLKKMILFVTFFLLLRLTA
ncbi:MAG: hypothetical protein Kow0037_21630 [Calditrichia bacterium]